MLHLICDSMTRESDNLESLGLPYGFAVLVQPLVLLLVYAYYSCLTLVHAAFPDSSLLPPKI